MGIVYTKEQQAENRKKWVEALRSGDYKQTQNVLTDGNNYCCLGVACDISDLGEWEEFETKESGGFEYIVNRDYSSEKSSIDLPNSVQNWLGLYTISGASVNGVAKSLVTLNDEGSTFNEIADAIENEENKYYV